MNQQIPQIYRANAAALSQVEPLTLLKIQITAPDASVVTLRYCAEKTVNWQSQTWALAPFSLTGEGERAGGEQSRPRLVLANPESLFSYYISEGWMDGARITKYEVHPDDLASGQSTMSVWYVSQVEELNAIAISLQLSTLSDGNSFKLPGRRFTQPEFGLVRL